MKLDQAQSIFDPEVLLWTANANVLFNGLKPLIMKKTANRICCFLILYTPWMGVYRC